jgi:hypothetical protein
MTAEEFAIARAKLGWSDERLAAELQVSPKAVRAWSDGTLRIPKHEAQTIAWEAAGAERQAALAAAGLRECAWVKTWEAEPLPKRTKDLVTHFKRLESHAQQCGLCQERERFLRERFPDMPDVPGTPLMSGFAAWDRFLQRFPKWTQPVFNGAAIVTILVAIRILFALPRGATPLMLIAIPAGAALGAVGGLAYSALRPYIAAGGARKTLAHIVVLLTYATAGFAIVDMGGRISSGLALAGSIGLWSFLVVAAVVGLLWQLKRDAV